MNEIKLCGLRMDMETYKQLEQLGTDTTLAVPIIIKLYKNGYRIHKVGVGIFEFEINADVMVYKGTRSG